MSSPAFAEVCLLGGFQIQSSCWWRVIITVAITASTWESTRTLPCLGPDVILSHTHMAGPLESEVAFKTYESPGKWTHFFLMRSSMFSLAAYLQGDFVFKSFKELIHTVSSQLCVNRGKKSLGEKNHIWRSISCGVLSFSSCCNNLPHDVFA